MPRHPQTRTAAGEAPSSPAGRIRPSFLATNPQAGPGLSQRGAAASNSHPTSGSKRVGQDVPQLGDPRQPPPASWFLLGRGAGRSRWSSRQLLAAGT